MLEDVRGRNRIRRRLQKHVLIISIDCICWKRKLTPCRSILLIKVGEAVLATKVIIEAICLSA